ncbi:MAG: hypothetical protein J3K34DRAFT_369221 [Monoraphidium minutum]|nr:MAG: hypothetical protein J3K34DRAFT_369221 [Monoraphidium minutum]
MARPARGLPLGAHRPPCRCSLAERSRPSPHGALPHTPAPPSPLPPGPELLQLTRGVDEDGDECVEAHKVTGDDNVPCGQLSFRAKVGRRHRSDPKPHYPEEMGVSARYPGSGRIADAGFANAKWVDGELLLFSGAANPLVTGGARVGFVWSVPNDRRFLILLNRVALA